MSVDRMKSTHRRASGRVLSLLATGNLWPITQRSGDRDIISQENISLVNMMLREARLTLAGNDNKGWASEVHRRARMTTALGGASKSLAPEQCKQSPSKSEIMALIGRGDDLRERGMSDDITPPPVMTPTNNAAL